LNKFSLAQFEEEACCRGKVDDEDAIDAANSIITVGDEIQYRLGVISMGSSSKKLVVALAWV